MKKNTFAVKFDPEDGRKYMYQAIDEADKIMHKMTHQCQMMEESMNYQTQLIFRKANIRKHIKRLHVKYNCMM